MTDRFGSDQVHSTTTTTTTKSAIEMQLDAISNSYSSLSSFLAASSSRLTQNAMVPLGKYGMIPGQLYNTNKVLVSMGENWFVEMSVHDAQEVIQRRQSYIQDERNTRMRRAQMLEYSKLESIIDREGDAVNEEGLKFVEIKEIYEDSTDQVQDRSIGNQTMPKVLHKTDASREVTGGQMGSFEKDLFKRMDELELEESRYLAKEAVTDDDDEEKEQDSDEAALTDDDFNHPGNRSDVDVPSEDDEQSDDEKEEEDLTSQKPVRRVSFAKDSKSGDGSFPSEAGARGIPPPSSSQWIPVRNLVVETEDPEEIFENESDVEEYQLGREIALEYAWRRNRLEVTNSIPRKGTGLPSEGNVFEKYDNVDEEDYEAGPSVVPLQAAPTVSRSTNSRFKPNVGEDSSSKKRVSKFKASRQG